MKKFKKWLIEFIKKQLIKQYQKWLMKIKIITFLILGVFVITPYENYIMYPSIKYFGEWMRYPCLTVEAVALIAYGVWMFKHLRPKQEPDPSTKPIVENNNEIHPNS
jgi:hypothetical protein